jgi:hypothetical protein
LSVVLCMFGRQVQMRDESETRLPSMASRRPWRRRNIFLKATHKPFVFRHILLRISLSIQQPRDMDAIQTAFGHDTALCDRILAAASKFCLTGTNTARDPR